MTFKTLNTLYTLRDMGDGGYLISGHPFYCPLPVLCRLIEAPTVGHRVTALILEGPYQGAMITTPVAKLGDGGK